MALRNDYEISELASVRELYHFYIDDGSWFDYRYTNRDEDFINVHEANSPLYSSVNITRGKIKQSGASSSSTLTINIGASADVSKVFLNVPPNGGVNVVISAAYNETEGAITDPDNLVFYRGVVTSAVFKGASVELSCESKFKVLDRLSLRRKVSVHCPFALFSSQCKVSAAAARRLGVVTTVLSPTLFTVEESPSGGGMFGGNLNTVYEYSTHYHGGFVKYTEPVGNLVHRIGVLSYSYGSVVSGDTSEITLTLDRPAPNLLAGVSLDMYPGCARNTVACYNKFGNLDNYGGIPYLTTDEPFASAFRTPLA